MRKRAGRRIGCTVLVAIVLALLAALAGAALLIGPFGRSDGPGSIANGLLSPIPRGETLIRFQRPDFSAPIAHVPVPRHPFMAGNAGNNMHNDAYMSDTSEASGPLGVNSQIKSRTQGFGGYGTIAFDSQARLVGVYSNGRGFQLELMDPYSLEELASYNLPPRPAYFFLQGVMPWQYIGAGTYFYLDNLDRAVVPTTANTVQVVQVPDMQQRTRFELVKEYDLSAYVVPMTWPYQDSVAWVLPDWSGRYYWYATTAGMVGTIDVESGEVHALRLDGETVENSFAVAEDGVYIISDRALYRFTQDSAGQIVTEWRTAYDRGPRKKPGVITRGSGTSVTLIGERSERQGVVAITDNAEPQIHLLFVRRSDGAVLCQEPLFRPGRSATDITVIGVEQPPTGGQGPGTLAAIAENNWGHQVFPFPHIEPGITRVDLLWQADGSARCQTVWTSAEHNLGVFKLSLGSGLLYLYSGEGSPFNQHWYFTAVDFRTGETVYRQLAGTGLGYDNWAAALFIHPDGGTAYSTTIFGLVMMRDTTP